MASNYDSDPFFAAFIMAERHMSSTSESESPSLPQPTARPTKFTTFRVDRTLRDRLKALKKELGFSTYNALFSYMVLEQTRGAVIPPAEYSIAFEKLGTRPIIITGESGAGKTTAVKDLLSKWSGSVFVLDVNKEYPDFDQVDFGGIFSTALWKREGQRIRFVTNQESKEAARGEASSIFGHLNYLKNAGQLHKWVIVVEEGHNFSQDTNLRALLIEGRKFCRKVILVTTDYREFSGIAKAFKPLPWQTEEGQEEKEVTN